MNIAGLGNTVMNKFLIFSVSVLLLAIAIAVGVFAYIQLRLFIPEETAKNSQPQTQTVLESENEMTDGGDQVGLPHTSTQPEGIPLNTLPLTEAQQAMLSQFNIDYDTFIITDAMIVCAKAEIGESRFGEIVAGSAPSFSESLKLFGCT